MRIIYLTILLVLVSCNRPTVLHEFYTEPATSGSNILLSDISLQTIELESILSSLGGRLTVSDEGFNFIDYNFGWIFVFDFDGNLIDRRLGIGRGPNEIPSGGITFYSSLDSGGHLFIGSSANYYIFDASLTRKQKGMLRWKQDKPLEYLTQNPTPEDQRSYNLAYFISEVKTTSEHAYLPLIGGPREYTNFSMDTDLFAKEARILAKMNLEDGQIEEIFGRYPPSYYNNPEKRPLSFFFFDIIDDEILAITFAADPFIHLFTLDFKHIASFGVEGNKMDTSYELFTGSSTRFEHFMMNQMRTKGYYSSLKYIPETNLLFRGYSKGTESEKDGMQVYKNEILIADFKVPKEMRIAGYNAPWYYSDADVDERNESIKVYRFKVEL